MKSWRIVYFNMVGFCTMTVPSYPLKRFVVESPFEHNFQHLVCVSNEMRKCLNFHLIERLLTYVPTMCADSNSKTSSLNGQIRHTS